MLAYLNGYVDIAKLLICAEANVNQADLVRPGTICI